MDYNVFPIANGIAVGKALNVTCDVNLNDINTGDKELEYKKIEHAILEVINDLNNIIIENKIEDSFINVHVMILKDPTLLTKVKNEIDKGLSGVEAFSSIFDYYIDNLKNVSSLYLEERQSDFKDIKRRVLAKLSNESSKESSDDVILVCDELYPSYLLEYSKYIKGVIARRGGPTSHGAILCRAREIPFVIYNGPSIDDFEDIIIDTRVNRIAINPEKKAIDAYKVIIDSKPKTKRIKDFFDFNIKLLANVSNNSELKKVRDYKMYGVGLYRSEFIFMNKNRALTEDEQYQIYDEAVEILKQRPICFRTFDLGEDKQVSYIKTYHRGIDNYKNNKELFDSQLRALIRANHYSNMKIMFPMIEDYSEYAYLRDRLVKIKKELHNNNHISIGMMLETKSALEHIDDFKDVDFISLGTNDLTNELYNIKRDEVSKYQVYINDLITKLKKVVVHCKKYNIELSICGEIAGIGAVTSALIDIGIRNFSVSVSSAKTLESSLLRYLGMDDKSKK